MEERRERLSFMLRMLHNQIKAIVRKSVLKSDMAPQSQLQGGILGFLYCHQNAPVYQKDIEKEFRISRATATNTLQVMEKNGQLVRKSQDKDARLKRIFLTKEALANHMKVEENIQMLDDRMLRGISEEEKAQLYRLLKIVMQNLEELEGELSAEDTDAEEPGAEEPGAEESDAEAAGAEEPGAEESDAEAAGTEEPGTEESGAEAAGTEEPGTKAPKHRTLVQDMQE